jgi:2-iminobutanoate/2-iminopropanoate deaminase
MDRKVISTPNAPTPSGHFSQGIIYNNILYTAGQIAQNVNKQMQNASVSDEVNQIMKNLDAVAKAAGTTLDKTLKATIFITDIKDFTVVNEAYKKYFPLNPPARSTVEVSNLALGARVEIELVIAME